MATESSPERSNEATVTQDLEPVIKIHADSQNADAEHSTVNGDTANNGTDDIDNKQISDVVDDLVNSAEVSISGGSDTEASRSKSKDDEKGHGRTSSTVKKPASFKSVSVNKTFLAAKGAATTGASKPGDKTTPTASLTSAQGAAATNTLRPRLVAKSGGGSISKSSALNGGKAGAAPDPSAVWNKNRPPEPKKFTDEELKKYGIHMATRLVGDDAKGQNTWADIDDDDEDWAPPETITWKDGTKITIPQTEELPAPPTPEPVAQQSPARANALIDKPKSPAPVLLSGASPSTKPGVLASGKGLVLKGVPEKPTLVAKPPAPPTPVKSPWAPIPKTANSITMDLPPQQSGPARFVAKDGSAPKSATPPPPKEIAADDFSRAPWRDGPGAGNRELFNSQSGRYEPVTDRRAAGRNEPHSRQPALLQRNAQEGPAEPSASFQTSRVSEQHGGSYSRRRASSTVSGGSGSYLRGKAHDQPLPQEVVNTRRESFTVGSDSPVSPRNFSPSSGPQSGARPQGNQNWQPHISPASGHAVPHQPGPPADNIAPSVPPPASSVVTEQVMQDQKKLMLERREAAMKRRLEEEREDAARKERLRLKLEAMGPAPESRSERAAAKHESPSATPGHPLSGPADKTPPVNDAPKRVETKPIILAKPESKTDDTSPKVELPAQSQTAPLQENTSQSQGSTHAHPWPNAAGQPERYASWSAQGQNKNVWGYPNSDRSLGNGTFNADLGHLPDSSQMPQVPSKTGPGPIAPPNANRNVSKSQPNTATTTATAARQPPIGPPRQVLRPGVDAKQRSVMQNAWAASVRENDASMDQELRARREEEMRKLESEGRTLADAQAPIKESWRPVKLDDDGRRVNEGPKQLVPQGNGPSWAPPAENAPSSDHKSLSGVGQSHGNLKASEASILAAGTAAAQQPPRGSRFFPSRDVRLELANAESRRSLAPSPPPPDMAGHPAFDGDVARPHVSLPRPQPVVRLPPSVPDVTSSSIAAPKGPSFSWAAPAPYRENEVGQIVKPNAQAVPRGPTQGGDGRSWQARIDNLLGARKGQSPPNSAPVDSLRRPQLAAGSSGGSPFSLVLDSSITSKGMAEECFEEQEMGSLPPIRLPSKVPETAWQPYPLPKPMPKKFWASILSVENLSFSIDSNNYRILLPGMNDHKLVPIPFARTRSNPRRQNRGGRHPSQPHRGGKGRDGSASYSNEAASGPPTPSSSRGGRGGFRGRGDWSRSSPAPIQT